MTPPIACDPPRFRVGAEAVLAAGARTDPDEEPEVWYFLDRLRLASRLPMGLEALDLAIQALAAVEAPS